jgi:hypothetical protein
VGGEVVSVSHARVLIGDKSGTIIAEIEPDITEITWRKNAVGKTRFSIARTDEKATGDNLKFGNRILIQFENGLPNWGGIIDPPRTWESGNIVVDAFSGEKIFEFRTTGKERYFNGATIGEIYAALIGEANVVEHMGINLGDVWDGGSSHSPSYHYKKLLDIFQKSLIKRLSNADFYVKAIEEAGKINFYADLYQSRGSDKTQFALVQDKNLMPIKLKEQGPIINSWDVAGEGLGWGVERLTSSSEDGNSRDIYGLREGARVYSDVSLQSTLDEHAETLKEEFKDPYNIFTIKAANKTPALFGDYDIGDTIRLIVPDVGFDGTDTTVRLITRTYDPQDGVCKLVVQEQ